MTMIILRFCVWLESIFISFDFCFEYFSINPHSILDLSARVVEATVSISFIVFPITQIISSIAPNESPIPIFLILDKKSFVNVTTSENLSTNSINLQIMFINLLPKQIVDNFAETCFLQNWILWLNQNIYVDGSKFQPFLFGLLVTCRWNALHQMNKLFRKLKSWNQVALSFLCFDWQAFATFRSY